MVRKVSKSGKTSKTKEPAKRATVTATTATTRERNIQEFLKAAVKADPSTAAGKAALRAAQSAALRLARDLKQEAAKAAGKAAIDLERRSNEALFRAVLAKELPNIVQLMKRKRPTIEEPPQAAPVAFVAPGAPTNVIAEAAVLSATVRWTAPVGPVTNYRVTPFIGASAQPFTIVGGTMTEATIVGLTANATYTFTVVASNPPLLGGDSPASTPSNPVTILGLPATGGGPIDLPLPAFSSDPALLIDTDANVFKSFLGDATRIGQKWRYEHLKAQAIAAARESMLYEEHIARLMAMALDKLGTAEQMLNNTLLDAVGRGRDIINDQIKATSSPDFTDLLDPLGDTAAQALLLPKFFAFLVETSPIKFWIGLFEAMISDLASVIPLFDGPTDFGRTRKYIRDLFNDPTNDVRKAVSATAAELLGRLDADVEQMMAPLRAATAAVIAGTRQAMADVFEGFDVTLLMTPSATAGAPDVPDLDPLESLYQRLNAPIDDLAQKVKDAIKPKLQQLVNGVLAKGDGNLFEAIVIAFLVLPILAFLIISLAGGPFSAALLAAVVLIAAEELLHLLVQWLAGPLLKKIDELNQKLNGLVGQLQAFFAQQAAIARNESPELVLKVLASQLRELRDFLPSAFLEETAGLLAEARNIVLSTATQLALGAEQALGLENATAFEAIGDDYRTLLEQAPQLPGGRDSLRYAGAALLRDFGRLEEQRIGIRDGKEVEFTHRISLLRLLGGTLTNFLQKRELVVSLTEQDLIDRMFPGIYRALIKEVRVSGLLGGTIDPRVCGIPLSVTHLGPSSTRIKRSANPAAPPLGLPDCFPKTAPEFSIPVVGTPPIQIPPVSNIFGLPNVIFGPPGADALEEQIKQAFATLTVTINDYATTFIVGLVLLLLGLIDDVQEFVCQPLRRALIDNLPNSLERRTSEVSCGFVDPTSIVSAAQTLISTVRLGDIFASLVLPADANQHLNEIPNLDAGVPELAARFQVGFVTANGTTLPGLVGIAQQAWSLALKVLLRRIAHWGDVDFVEDPDPQVRALGFVRLVRNLPSETMAFNLFQDGPSPTQIKVDSLTGTSSDGFPAAPSSVLQYRLFENRGIEGDLLIRLESLDDDSILPLPAGTLIQQLSTNLTDVLLDITFRGCYDADLAQTVRSSRRQTAIGLNVASRIPGALGPIALPGSLVSTDIGASELRTVHYSMRAHRDKTLQVLTAAVAQPTPPAVLLNLVTGKSVLGRDAAFEPLDPAITNFTFELNNQDLANTVAALQSLVAKLQISPNDLAFDPSILSPSDTGATATLIRVGVAVIPMPDGVRGEDDDPDVDPMAVQLQVNGLLGDVFPDFATSAPLPDRLRMTVVDPGEIPPSINPPSVADLFSAPVKPALVFTLDGALTGGSKLYDIIVSLTFRVPKLKVRTAINGLR